MPCEILKSSNTNWVSRNSILTLTTRLRGSFLQNCPILQMSATNTVPRLTTPLLRWLQIQRIPQHPPPPKFDMLLQTRFTELKKSLYLADYKDTIQDQSSVRDAYSMVWSLCGGGHTSFPALFNPAYPCAHQLRSSSTLSIQEFL